MRTKIKILLGGGTAAALVLIAAAGIQTRHGSLLAGVWQAFCPPCSATVWTGTTCRPPTRSTDSQYPLVDAARQQIGVTVTYDPAYVKLAYPGGDVPPDRGVCADVVIRAFRDARGLDLQKLVHEDMAANFKAYPNRWGLRRPDANIDHRRVLNLEVFFRRQGWAVPVSTNAVDYLPGDIVACTVAGKLPHIMVVSDRKSAAGVPLVIHNIGCGTREEDRLFAFPQTSHSRPPPVSKPSSVPLTARCAASPGGRGSVTE